jgi:predicted RNase H-like nuclease (RuvC/YqgF family)
MTKPRRQFLFYAGAIFSGAICGIRLHGQPQSRKMPTPPDPAQTESRPADDSNARISQRAVLQQHVKQFRDSLASLAERVSQLKQEVEELHSAEVFSVKIYKQTSEIERLAKQLKNLARN